MCVWFAAVLLGTSLLATSSFMATCCNSIARMGDVFAIADWPSPIPIIYAKAPAQERELMTVGMTQQVGVLGQSQGTDPVDRNGLHDPQRSSHLMPVKWTGELRRLQVTTSSAVQDAKSKVHKDAQIARYVVFAFLGLPFVLFICFLGYRGELLQAMQ